MHSARREAPSLRARSLSPVPGDTSSLEGARENRRDNLQTSAVRDQQERCSYFQGLSEYVVDLVEVWPLAVARTTSICQLLRDGTSEAFDSEGMQSTGRKFQHARVHYTCTSRLTLHARALARNNATLMLWPENSCLFSVRSSSKTS